MKKHNIISKAFIVGVMLLGNGSMLPALGSEIYSYVDADGVWHYSDRPPTSNSTIKINPLSTEQSLDSSVKIYKFVDSKGVIHLTDQPKDSRYKLIYLGNVKVPSFATSPNSSVSIPQGFENYKTLIQDVATNMHLEPALLHAVIQVESAYNPYAVSPKGAVGLMQLMPATAKRFGVTDSTDATSNVYGGARYLRYLLKLFNNNLRLALAGYNAGENAVKRYGNKIPPYRETKNYVKKVMKLYRTYREHL